MPTETSANPPDTAPLGLLEQVGMLSAGGVTSRELVEDALRRTEAAQADLNAFRVIRAEEALEEADAADRRIAAGEGAPLLGVPIAIKEDVDLTGHPTLFGCGGSRPPADGDAEVVRRLREAGAIVIGKTHAPEVGQWPFTEGPSFGATRNPWSTAHTPGGSSGGAAAAVAAGLVPAAIGSDGAGSIRIPAAWTGLVGLKPQRGRISTWPEAEAFNGLTCFGPLARSVADAALLLDAIARQHPGRPPQAARRPRSRSPSPPLASRGRCGSRSPSRPRSASPINVDPEHRAAIEAFAEQLGEMGHEVVRADPDYGLVGPAIVPRGMAGVDAWLSENIDDRSNLEPRTRTHARVGRLLSGLPLRASRAAEPALRRRLGRIFDRFDLVLTPTTAKPPPRIYKHDGRGYWATSTAAGAACPYGFAWNVVGWPGISVPAGTTEAGLPIGAQLLGPEDGEALLLELAGSVERAVGGFEPAPYPRRDA